MVQFIASPLILLLQLLVSVAPVIILVVGWRWGAEMLRELRAIRKQLDAIATGTERIENGEEQPR